MMQLPQASFRPHPIHEPPRGIKQRKKDHRETFELQDVNPVLIRKNIK